MRLARRQREAFTLIEMMAVVAIGALLAAFVMPQIGAVSGRNLRMRAEDIGTHLQLARERSVLTGAPHRLLFDLESSGYRVEWWVTEARAKGDDEPEEIEPAFELTSGIPIPMAAPPRRERSWQPLTGKLGSFAWSEEGVRIAGIETAGDWVEKGDVGIEFDSDGTTTPAAVFVDDENDRRLRITVLPLADGVTIENEE